MEWGGYMEICDIIKKIREERDLSQEGLAAELHVGFTTISRWENSHTKPNRMARHMILEYCKKKKISKELIKAFQKTK